MKLVKDDKFEWVTCPSCSHSWYEKLYSIERLVRDTTWCPKCHTPLKEPNYIDILKEDK